MASGVAVRASADNAASRLFADVVILAAGVGIGKASLGAAVPMVHSPGTLAHTAPAPNDDSARMRAIFVDTTSGTHCLQRDDGRCIVGGDLSGYGVVEDAAAGEAAASGDHAAGDTAAGDELLLRAARALPFLAGLPLEATTTAEPVSYTHLTLPTICSV